LPGKTLYRIRALKKDGQIELSPTIVVNTNDAKAGISFYPNPVTNSQMILLSLQNLQRGNYSVRILTAKGQVIQQQKIVHENGNSGHTIILLNATGGTYVIEVYNQLQHFVKVY